MMKAQCGNNMALVFCLVLNALGHAQVPLSLDQEFSISHNAWYVSSLLPMEDGKVLASGQLRNAGDILFKSMLRFNADGSVDPNFNSNGIGGGQMVRWNDKIYVAGTQTVRRIQLSGIADPTFQHMNNDPLFSSLQGGDYHVYPDGSILLSGLHNLDDTARGFVGLYNLIWFTNTGHLDTTKIHRKGNGAIYEIEQQPDGKFLCSGACTIYDGQPVRKVFRVQPDGALDTTFDSGITWGEAFGFLPLPDGRSYAVGIMQQNSLPLDTLRCIRLLANGELDTSFIYDHNWSLGTIPNYGNLGVTLGTIQHIGNKLLVTGYFQAVNGQPRLGLCMLDSTGALSTEFHNAGVGPYTYQDFVYGGVDGAVLTPDNMLYVYGAYHGYTDGTTNDPDQRFITRLYGPDLTTGVAPEPLNTEAELRVHPNPGTGAFVLELLLDGLATAQLLDASGRVVHSQVLTSGTERHNLHTGLLPGAYVLRVRTADGRTLRGRVVVQ
jgi:uncharacterized delta-60 repeat protein